MGELTNQERLLDRVVSITVEKHAVILTAWLPYVKQEHRTGLSVKRQEH